MMMMIMMSTMISHNVLSNHPMSCWLTASTRPPQTYGLMMQEGGNNIWIMTQQIGRRRLRTREVCCDVAEWPTYRRAISDRYEEMSSWVTYAGGTHLLVRKGGRGPGDIDRDCPFGSIVLVMFTNLLWHDTSKVQKWRKFHVGRVHIPRPWPSSVLTLSQHSEHPTTVMRRITTFRLTTDRIYDGRHITL